MSHERTPEVSLSSGSPHAQSFTIHASMGQVTRMPQKKMANVIGEIQEVWYTVLLLPIKKPFFMCKCKIWSKNLQKKLLSLPANDASLVPCM